MKTFFLILLGLAVLGACIAMWVVTIWMAVEAHRSFELAGMMTNRIHREIGYVVMFGGLTLMLTGVILFGLFGKEKN